MSKRTIEVDKRDFVIVFEDQQTRIVQPEEKDDNYFGQFLGLLVARRIQQIAESEEELKNFIESVSVEMSKDFTKWKQEQQKDNDEDDEDDDLQHTATRVAEDEA
jgi:mannose-6-phosphate isomerase class I